MTDDFLFYRGLAERLRRVHASQTRRANEQNDSKRQGGAVGLDEVLNALDSGALDSVITDVQAQTNVDLKECEQRFQNRSPDSFSMHFSDEFMPADPFRGAVTRFFAGQLEDTANREQVARAIVSALAIAADEGGMLTDADVQRRLGPQALAILQAVKGKTTSTTSRAKLKYQGLDLHTGFKVARSRERKTFIERMPLMDEITRLLGGPHALAGFQMVSVQHLFPSTLGLYDALEDNGLPRSTTSVGGKNYSSNADAVARMDADGLDVHHLAKPEPQQAGLNAEKLVYDMAVSQLSALFAGVDPNEKTPRFLLLDDGGKLIRALHEKFPRYAHLCVAVEQTDRGIQHIEEMKKNGVELLCPVVNMARSDAKKLFEGPMIGESVVFHAELEIESASPELKARVEADKTATIIGYGAVGKATADALRRRGYTVTVTDIDPEALERARADGCVPLPREEALAASTLVFGCTGKQVLFPSDYSEHLKDGAIVINAASGNHEFGLHDVPHDFFDQADKLATVDENGIRRGSFGGQPIVIGDEAEGDAIQNRVLRFKSGKEVMALRSGYVVNMTLGLPPEYVQLTLGLLLASCLQAVKEGSPGLKDIPAEVQAFLVSRVRAHLAAQGLSLEAPDFRTLASWRA